MPCNMAVRELTEPKTSASHKVIYLCAYSQYLPCTVARAHFSSTECVNGVLNNFSLRSWEMIPFWASEVILELVDDMSNFFVHAD